MNQVDPTFIMQVQLAIIGVVVVVGLFYIWRIVTRIEDKVDALRASRQAPSLQQHPQHQQHQHQQEQQASLSCPIVKAHPHPPTDDFRDADGTLDYEDAHEAADAIMKSVFGDVIMMSTIIPQGPSTSSVKVTEIEPVEDAPAQPESAPEATSAPSSAASGPGTTEVEIEDEDDDDTPSVATADGKLSKTKLKAMSVNMLKELCSQKGLSTEGSKQTLIVRLAATL